MLCVDYFPEGNLNITAVYLYIYVFPGIRDAGKDFICQYGNIIFTVGLYKIVESPDLKSSKAWSVEVVVKISRQSVSDLRSSFAVSIPLEPFI